MELDQKDYGHRIAPHRKATGVHIDVPAISMYTLIRQLEWNRIGLLKMDIEGHEKVLFAGDCSWLDQVDSMCIEWHDDDGEVQLTAIAKRFGFLPPQQLPGIWFLARAR